MEHEIEQAILRLEARLNDRILDARTSVNAAHHAVSRLGDGFAKLADRVTCLEDTHEGLGEYSLAYVGGLESRIAGLHALCDEWDRLSKGETGTTKQIRTILNGEH